MVLKKCLTHTALPSSSGMGNTTIKGEGTSAMATGTLKDENLAQSIPAQRQLHGGGLGMTNCCVFARMGTMWLSGRVISHTSRYRAFTNMATQRGQICLSPTALISL